MKTLPHIAIVDYGVGNLWSLSKALAQFADVEITEERQRIEKADAIILPGVGTFKAGMDGLAVRGLAEVIKERARASVPVLGICLGAQLLLERGHEFGEQEGLGLIKGEVVQLPAMPPGVTMPVIGWQEVVPTRQPGAATLFAGITNPFFYFVHSYMFVPREESVLAKTTYGGYQYAAAFGEDNIFGIQFHPEKSGPAGLKLLENFIRSLKQ
ncbi:MAG: Imidazole glycerol phosphate synthase subunit HisH [Parcubacteria group bacterium GW2011_GWA1_47_11]|nr:MAG: Imidazole glycerol phosphate synthase subunit HisH [Parcubacteria group bacterium GW2011_GWA1_47_11]